MTTSDGTGHSLVPVGGRRRSRIALGAWLGTLLTVVVWVSAAGVGSPRSPQGPIAGGPAGSPSTGVPNRTTAPEMSATQRPSGSNRAAVTVLEGPPPTGTIHLRDGAGLRPVDLASGGIGDRIGPASWPDRLLRLPNGSFVCLCQERREDNGTVRVELRLTKVFGSSLPPIGPIVTVEGRRDPNARPDEQFEPIDTSAALSPNGRLMAVSVAALQATEWRRSVLVVDLEPVEIVQEIDLGTVPVRSSTGGTVAYTWAPTVRFSPGGDVVLVGSTVVTGDEPSDEAHWIASVDGGRLDVLRRIERLGAAGGRDDACPWASPAFADSSTVYSFCSHPNGGGLQVRIVSLDHGRPGSVRDVALGDHLPQGFVGQLVEPATGALIAWDPFGGHAVRIDLPGARIEASTTVPRPEASVGMFERLAGLIAPPARAKILLEPALAASADGSRIYVVAMDDAGPATPGSTSRVHVLDARTLEPLDAWSLDPGIVSIGVHEAGVILASQPEGPGGIVSRITIVDPATGRTRAWFELLGMDWPVIVDPAALGN